MVGATGAIPSHDLFEAHGKSVSSALSAMHPDTSATPNPRSNALISEYDIADLGLVLFPRAEDVADDIVLALDFLS